MKKIAYIVQDDGTKNFSSLLHLVNEVVVVTGRDCPVFDQVARNDHIGRIRSMMRPFDLTNDYVVLVGDPVNIGIVAHAVLKKGGCVFLKWDRQEKCYQPIKILED